MRLLHTMLRVGNLERSIRFYTDTLGMTLLRQKDYPGVNSASLSSAMAMKKTILRLSLPTTGRRITTTWAMVLAISPSKLLTFTRRQKKYAKRVEKSFANPAR